MPLSQAILNALGIPYADCPSQAAVDQKAADAQTVLAAMVAGTYQSPTYPAGNTPPTDPGNVAMVTAASVTLQAAVRSGNIIQAHADLDALNMLRAASGQSADGISSDFVILQNANGTTGDLARWVVLQYDPDTGVDLAHPNMLLTPATLKQAQAAVATQLAAPPPPPPAPPSVVALPAGTVLPNAEIFTMPDGSKWQVANLPFGDILIRVASLLLFALLLFTPLHARAQVEVTVVPTPQAVLSALHLRSMGMASVYMVNRGAAARLLAPEEVYTAIVEALPISPDQAALILTQKQSMTAPATIAKVLSYVGQATAIALAVASKANIPVAFWVQSGSAAVPQVETVIEGAIPSIAPYSANSLNSAISLAPGGSPGASVTKTVFVDRARWKKQVPIEAMIQ